MPYLIGLTRTPRGPLAACSRLHGASPTLASFLALIGALLALLAVPVAASAAGTLDQSVNATPGSGVGYYLNDSVLLGQTFTAGITGALDHVDLNLKRSPYCEPYPGPLTVEIRTTWRGNLTPIVLATATIPGSSVNPGYPSYVSVPFTPRAPSVAGTQYTIVLSAPVASPSCPYVWYLSNSKYAVGGFVWSPNGGSTWGGGTPYDANFRTYVVENSGGASGAQLGSTAGSTKAGKGRRPSGKPAPTASTAAHSPIHHTHHVFTPLHTHHVFSPLHTYLAHSHSKSPPPLQRQEAPERRKASPQQGDPDGRGR